MNTTVAMRADQSVDNEKLTKIDQPTKSSREIKTNEAPYRGLVSGKTIVIEWN